MPQLHADIESAPFTLTETSNKYIMQVEIWWDHIRHPNLTKFSVHINGSQMWFSGTCFGKAVTYCWAGANHMTIGHLIFLHSSKIWQGKRRSDGLIKGTRYQEFPFLKKSDSPCSLSSSRCDCQIFVYREALNKNVISKEEMAKKSEHSRQHQMALRESKECWSLLNAHSNRCKTFLGWGPKRFQISFWVCFFKPCICLLSWRFYCISLCEIWPLTLLNPRYEKAVLVDILQTEAIHESFLVGVSRCKF